MCFKLRSDLDTSSTQHRTAENNHGCVKVHVEALKKYFLENLTKRGLTWKYYSFAVLRQRFKTATYIYMLYPMFGA